MNRFAKLFVVIVLGSTLISAARAAEAPAKLDLNKATLEELIKLPRVGPAVAQRIVEFRKEQNGFRKAEDLLNVRGVGPKTFELLKDKITVGEGARTSAAH